MPVPKPLHLLSLLCTLWSDQWRTVGRAFCIQKVPAPLTLPKLCAVDEFLLDSWEDPSRRAYDGIWLETLPDLAAGAAAASSTPIRFTALVNQTAVHALPAAISQLHSALLRRLTGDPAAAIATTSWPLPLVAGEVEARASQASAALLLVLFTCMAAAVMSASAAIFLVRERASRSKAVQVIAGAGPLAFCGSTLAWDMVFASVR